MKYKVHIQIIGIIACFSANLNLSGKAIITLFFKPYPQFITQEQAEHTAEKMVQPAYASKKIIKSLIDKNLASGIFATYGGFIAESDADGQISFPRAWHTDPVIYIVTTSRVTPMNINDATVDHWSFEDKTPASVHKMERKKDDETGAVLWHVTQQSVPENQRVPLKSILIFAKPKYIYIPNGITPTKDTPNLHLPDIYVRPGINKQSNALYVLHIRHFFGPIKRALKKEKKQYAVRFYS